MKGWTRRLLIIGLVAGALYAGLIAFADARALLRVLKGFRLGAIAVGLALTLSGFALRDARWLVYMRRLGARLPLRERLLLGLTSGKMGQVVKSYYLSEHAATPYRASIPAGFAERMSDVIAIILLLLVGLVFGPRFHVWQLALASAVLVAFLVALRSRALARLAARAMRRVPRWRTAASHLEESHEHFRGMLRVGPLLAPVAFGLAAYLLEATALWTLCRFGLGSDAVQWGEAAFAIAGADILGTLSLIPGGLGVTDGGLVVILRVLGLDLAPATAVALLLRALTLWLSVVLDGIAILTLHLGSGLTASKGPTHNSRQ